MRPHRAALQRAVALALGFLVLGQLCTLLAFPPHHSAALWLPAGLCLAVVARSPRAWWPLLLATVFAVEGLAFARGQPTLAHLAWALGTTLRTGLGAWLLQRWMGPGALLDDVHDVWGVFLASMLGPVFSATFGVGSLLLLREPVAAPPRDWVVWYLADALGSLMLAPLILAWPLRWGPKLTRARLYELGGVLVLLAAVSWFLFGSRFRGGVYPSLLVLCIPFVFWAALRTGPRGASVASSLLGAVALWQTTHGRGPFAVMGVTVYERILSAQAYVAVAAVFALLFAVLEGRRSHAEAQMRTLAEAGDVLSSSLDFRATFPRVGERLLDTVATGFGVWLIDREDLLGPAVASVGLPAPVERAFRSRARLSPETPLAWSIESGCALLFPLRGRERLLGALGLTFDGATGLPTARDRMLAEALAHRCTVAIENAQLYARAQEAVAARDEFLTVAAHELRTPVAVAKLRLQSLARESSDGLSFRLSPVARALGRLERLVQNLTEIGRINTGQLRLHRAEVDVSLLATELLEEHRDTADRTGSHLSFRVQSHVTGWLDRDLVAVALGHLLANALKFGAGRPVELEVSRSDGTILLAVRDHGIGIDPASLRRIFGRFEHAVAAREYGGLGLGLFITAKIAEAHGGLVEVESERGMGSTVRLRLPANATRPLEVGPPSAEH